ncbi:hypothetical protein BC828DRAFT_400095 [Blastocladiella britannica]|nr:hypothetical protein BC828DRAFT_400095 [Blastocladiella britannica]
MLLLPMHFSGSLPWTASECGVPAENRKYPGLCMANRGSIVDVAVSIGNDSTFVLWSSSLLSSVTASSAPAVMAAMVRLPHIGIPRKSHLIGGLEWNNGRAERVSEPSIIVAFDPATLAANFAAASIEAELEEEVEDEKEETQATDKDDKDPAYIAAYQDAYKDAYAHAFAKAAKQHERMRGEHDRRRELGDRHREAHARACAASDGLRTHGFHIFFDGDSRDPRGKFQFPSSSRGGPGELSSSRGGRGGFQFSSPRGGNGARPPHPDRPAPLERTAHPDRPAPPTRNGEDVAHFRFGGNGGPGDRPAHPTRPAAPARPDFPPFSGEGDEHFSFGGRGGRGGRGGFHFRGPAPHRVRMFDERERTAFVFGGPAHEWADRMAQDQRKQKAGLFA